MLTMLFSTTQDQKFTISKELKRCIGSLLSSSRNIYNKKQSHKIEAYSASVSTVGFKSASLDCNPSRCARPTTDTILFFPRYNFVIWPAIASSRRGFQLWSNIANISGDISERNSSMILGSRKSTPESDKLGAFS